MEHKFKVGDRVKHKYCGTGTILFLLKIIDLKYVIQKDGCIGHDIWYEEFISECAEPEKPQPKYKVGDIVWHKTVIAQLPDNDHEYYLHSFDQKKRGFHATSCYAIEENLRPLHDEPIKPEEAKDGMAVWAKAILTGRTNVRGEIAINLQLPDIEGREFTFYLPASSIKLRHEDE